MPQTNASIGYGILFGMADPLTPTVFTYANEVTSITPPAFSTDSVEVTTMQSTGRFREYVPGLSDGGNVELEMNYVPGSVFDLALQAARGVRRYCQVVFQNGVQVLFTAILETYQPDGKLDGSMTAKVSFKVSGQPIMTTPAAPVNAVLPTISGTAKVGSSLTLDIGGWGGAASFTYQWKKGAANISGATLASYVPVAGDVGGQIACQVTGVNPSFTTVVTTTATAAVVA